tara:strand:+ start:291 stop:539 length:249 start_codon:yes stop_codon:yes gene_type:complete
MKNTMSPAFVAAFGEIIDRPSFTTSNWKVNGLPEKRIVWILLSVNINISCRVLIAPTMNDPAVNVTPPAVFVEVGVQSNGFS